MSSETIASGQAGWFGKLPAAGDFLRRDLPDEFLLPWDEWLRGGMAAGAARYGDDWQDCFLHFPVWYFLRHGHADASFVWAGVLVPGADRVGRLFPFTAAFPVPAEVLLQAGAEAIESSLHALASHVLDVLADDDLDAFEQAMLALDPVPAVTDVASVSAGTPSMLAAQLGRRALLDRLAGEAIFWSDGDAPAPVLLAPEPLQADVFCQLLLPTSTPISAE